MQKAYRYRQCIKAINLALPQPKRSHLSIKGIRQSRSLLQRNFRPWERIKTMTLNPQVMMYRHLLLPLMVILPLRR